jgi:RNA ligase (TIGR02306 family)
LIRWIEIENIKRYPDIFEPGETVVATEKIHGTCCLYTLTADGREYVSSKGVGAQSLALQEDARNVYWRAVRRHKLREIAQEALAVYGGPAVGLFGEVYGKGVQDLHYGADAGSDTTLGYALFDVKVVPKEGAPFWLPQDYFDAFTSHVGVQRVPMVYKGPYDYGLLAAFANVKESMLDPGTLREGVVVRPMVERHSPVLGGRAIAKFVSDLYLERKGATEYE